MTPELRKEASELQLHKRGIRINVGLHVIEADEEVQLRRAEEVVQRLIALWAVSYGKQLEGSAGSSITVYRYLESHHLLNCLSEAETKFLQHGIDSTPSLALRQHAFHFLGWCAGLVPKIDLGQKPCDVRELLACFPTQLQCEQGDQANQSAAPTLGEKIKLRRKDVIMDWSDLLYRLHWAVRHAVLHQKPSPGNIDGELVREWHQAVNWMCCYEEEDNWDQVSTETTAGG
ncbi:DUF4272 domain-containing protein [Undibacterium cyanobacteriorum]|uniref:DUF4272 domain-containing protein n=1 Tax=Undibacterium cyanobacteriorum TaxID=3073561 RepID=A0ABY9RJ93_9BURK|nr:DUF4272 domain-containing protein [Undibacterium sp. 20NA77.5]WMW81303.1 DUF4272 domain-containing protein [Undibacterium sp. 20NA77.5]